jgi:hypothetical protein
MIAGFRNGLMPVPEKQDPVRHDHVIARRFDHDHPAERVSKMKISLGALLGAAAIIGLAAASDPALAQQKTVKQCTEEWRANKADNQAKGITLAAFVKECRAGTAAAQPAAPAAAPAQPAPAAAAPAGAQKTVKQCTEEWRANKADNQAKGITLAAFVKECRAGTVAAQPAAPAAAPAPTPTARPATAAPAAAPKPAPTTAAAPTGANQFASEAQAKARCPAGLVVWVNTDSNIYHFSGHKDYGTTKEGAYMCETDATAAGNRAAKNEKRP